MIITVMLIVIIIIMHSIYIDIYSSPFNLMQQPALDKRLRKAAGNSTVSYCNCSDVLELLRSGSAINISACLADMML